MDIRNVWKKPDTHLRILAWMLIGGVVGMVLLAACFTPSAFVGAISDDLMVRYISIAMLIEMFLSGAVLTAGVLIVVHFVTFKRSREPRSAHQPGP